MKKIYFAAPLLALAVFAGIYAYHRSEAASIRDAEASRERADKEKHLKDEREARDAAVENALKSQRERKAKKEALEAADKLALETRRKALDERDANRGARDRLARKLKASEQEIAAVEADIARIRREGDLAKAEADHREKLLKQTEANERALKTLLAKLPATPAPAAVTQS